MNLSLALIFGLTLAAQTDPLWRVPVTIEALRDVTVGRGPVARTRLSITGDDSDEFIIKKGERFQMVAIYREGQCRIRFKTMERDISSCYWLEEFSDQEPDVFKVISGQKRTRRGQP